MRILLLTLVTTRDNQEMVILKNSIAIDGRKVGNPDISVGRQKDLPEALQKIWDKAGEPGRWSIKTCLGEPWLALEDARSSDLRIGLVIRARSVLKADMHRAKFNTFYRRRR